MPRQRKRLLFAGALLLAVVAPACARRPLAGVGVKNLASELVFGIPPLPEAIVPANTVPFDIGPDFVVGGAPVRGSQTSVVGPPPPPQCEEAPLGAAPADPVPESINKAPMAGAYKYQYTVKILDAQAQSSGLEKRTVSNVQVTDQAGPNFTFKVTQKLNAQGADVEIVSTFTVDQTAPRQRAGPSVVPTASGRGIFLTRLERKVTVGTNKEQGTFVPNPPLKYMDLPARVGADGAFDTTAVDSASFTTIRHQGEITRRQPVDACGTMVDSWFAEATQTVTAPNGQTFVTKYNYGISTHFGGLITFEHIEFPANEPDYIFDFGIGQTSPDPA